MQLPEDIRQKLNHRFGAMSHDKGKGIMFFCKLADISTATLARLREGKEVKESTVERVVDALEMYDNYEPAKTERQIMLTNRLQTMLA
ncbi:hypothetical protein BWI93_11600 [Siphonobacter sp. BAB-5385]|nr:hypothetical protein BWI93_11600 [Siphonobacter sp. BAB-5385]